MVATSPICSTRPTRRHPRGHAEPDRPSGRRADRGAGGPALKLDDGSARAPTSPCSASAICRRELPPAQGGRDQHQPAPDRQPLGRGEPRPGPALGRGPGAGQRPDHDRRRDPARRPRPSGADPGALAPRPAAGRARATRRAPPSAWLAGPLSARGLVRQLRREIDAAAAPESTGGACSTTWRDRVPLLWQRLPPSSAGASCATCAPIGTSTATAWRPRSPTRSARCRRAAGSRSGPGRSRPIRPVRGDRGPLPQPGQQHRDPDRRRLAGQLRRPDPRLPSGPRSAGAGSSGTRAGASGAARPRPRDDARSADLRRNGRPNPSLFALGPLTRGTFWETSAVPEIREHGRALATQLLGEDIASAA